ncbi:uncharacterized protein YbjT (DUF2867 family) [Crossiella equi]|uniref:Uncharacterized protein YbjT (DUF2867 family) n=1 Tax=Crossiella equi TaxID=130796 RepID=A0ABS5ANE6_9PSEU|nr:hypothetical protein [Crossiella equi]MBP2478083.1 uncharacterized protein YbjT (DUF2867 family) [Crossiella equi]
MRVLLLGTDPGVTDLLAAESADVRHCPLTTGPALHEAVEGTDAVLLDRGHTGRAYHVTGLVALTQADRVRVLGQTFGRPWRYEEVPRETYRKQLLATWPPAHAEAFRRR